MWRSEFKLYLKERGNQNAFTVQTPSGGFHYYFNYSSTNPDDEVLIKTFLKNAAKYRGKDIHIRSTGGYIVAPPPRRLGEDYAILKNTAPIDIPSSLISWLIVGKPPVAPKGPSNRKGGSKQAPARELTQKAYEYDVSTEQIEAMLAKLPAKFLDNYSDWLVVTSVLKCHDQHRFWRKWSKQAKRPLQRGQEREPMELQQGIPRHQLPCVGSAPGRGGRRVCRQTQTLHSNHPRPV